jgi:hypothetical protein
MPKKLVSLLSISTILVSLALSVLACGNEPLTSGGPQNASPVTAAPTAIDNQHLAAKIAYFCSPFKRQMLACKMTPRPLFAGNAVNSLAQ